MAKFKIAYTCTVSVTIEKFIEADSVAQAEVRAHGWQGAAAEVFQRMVDDTFPMEGDWEGGDVVGQAKCEGYSVVDDTGDDWCTNLN